MKLIHTFHKMESENNLFDLGKDINLPIWDIIRYSVYVKYYYPEKDREKLSQSPKRNISDYFKLSFKVFPFIFGVLINRKMNVVLTASRYLNDKGEFFDKSALPILKALDGKCLVFEPIFVKKMAYSYLYDFSNLFRKFYKTDSFPMEYWTKLDRVLNENLETNLITYDEINSIIQIFKSDHFFYKTLFKILKNKKLIICTGNPKACILAAKDLSIETYLVQHAGIEIDEIDYSYCAGITTESPVLFADYVLTFGDYWCKNLNVPARKIIPIGNDFFSSRPNVKLDDSILVISTIVHGGELRKLTLTMSDKRPDLKIIYKLHPNEFHLKDEYIEYFKTNSNVNIITNEIDTSVLIAKSQLVVLIVSAVIYEALNQNKKVAVLKKINYERQLHLINCPNLYFFDFPEEVFDILSINKQISSFDFYKKSDTGLIKTLFE